MIYSILLMLAGAGLIGLWLWNLERPNDDRVAPDFLGHAKPIVFQGEVQPISAIGGGESLKLPLSFIQTHIDESIRYEPANQTLILTTADKVLRMQTEQLTAMVNERPLELRFPAESVEDEVYVPIAPLKELLGISVTEGEQTGAVIVRRAGETIQYAKVNGPSDDEAAAKPVRQAPGLKSPIVADAVQGEEVAIVRETDSNWVQVQLGNGIVGYMQEADLALSRTEIMPTPQPERKFVPWSPLGGKINLTWEAVYNNNNPDPSAIGPMPGLNVVSPTWFRILEDENGQVYVDNWADPAYVQWAHERGYQVWGLFSNDFDPDLTDKALRDPENRRILINQMLGYAQMYDLQGVNIDFENVYLENGEHVTQFVRELTPLFHEQGLVVSIDVTIRGGSEMWSLFYDRKALGEIVDYMMVMTYDEHWASSPQAGSVASLPWVEKGINDIMREDDVPASKLVLGVPYYTRVWSETTENGETKVSSEAVSMGYVEKLIKEKQLTKTYEEQSGQNYVEYEENGVKYRIWIEDETSMKARAELVKEYDLAGIASWRRGLETPNIWPVIEETLAQRP